MPYLLLKLFDGHPIRKPTHPETKSLNCAIVAAVEEEPAKSGFQSEIFLKTSNDIRQNNPIAVAIIICILFSTIASATSSDSFCSAILISAPPDDLVC